jgi:heme-degrading monooxygenase HmoA
VWNVVGYNTFKYKGDEINMASFVGFVMIGRVKNFEKFKSVFDANSNTRKSAGSKGGYLYSNAEDSNQDVILLEWDNLENAKEFLQSQELKDRMVEGGVIGTPEVILIEQVEKVKF